MSHSTFLCKIKKTLMKQYLNMCFFLNFTCTRALLNGPIKGSALHNDSAPHMSLVCVCDAYSQVMVQSAVTIVANLKAKSQGHEYKVCGHFRTPLWYACAPVVYIDTVIAMWIYIYLISTSIIYKGYCSWLLR